MARDGSGVYSYPDGTEGSSGETIESEAYNAFLLDIQGEQNAVRPILYGGTGATTAEAARTALGVMPTTGGTLSGNLTINKADPLIELQKTASGQSAWIGASTGTLNRWWFNLGDGTPETGGNAGSNFTLTRWNDAGAQMSPEALHINRQTGTWTIGGTMSVTGNAVVSGTLAATSTITGNDFHTRRSTTEGVIFFGSDNAAYLHRSSPTGFYLTHGLGIGGTLNIAGALTGVTTASFSSTLNCAAITCHAINSHGITCHAVNTQGQPISCGSLTATGTHQLVGGDTWLQRSGLPTQGLLHFGNSGGRYLHFSGHDGSNVLTASNMNFAVSGTFSSAAITVHAINSHGITCHAINTQGNPISCAAITSSTINCHAIACHAINMQANALTGCYYLEASAHVRGASLYSTGGHIYFTNDGSRYLRWNGAVGDGLDYNGQAIITNTNWTSYIPGNPTNYVQEMRWIAAGDYEFPLDAAMHQPYPSGVLNDLANGTSFGALGGRWRYLQGYNPSAGWVTVLY